MRFFRRRYKKYDREAIGTQLRLIRTHVAAQASEIATVKTFVMGIDQRDRDRCQANAEHRERVEGALDKLGRRQAVEGGGGQ